MLGFSRPWGPLRRGNGARPKRPDQTGQAHQTSSSSSGRSLRTAPAGGAGALYQSFQVGGPARQASGRKRGFPDSGQKTALGGEKKRDVQKSSFGILHNGVPSLFLARRSAASRPRRVVAAWKRRLSHFLTMELSCFFGARFAASPRRRCVEASPFGLFHNGTVIFLCPPATSADRSGALQGFSPMGFPTFAPPGRGALF